MEWYQTTHVDREHTVTRQCANIWSERKSTEPAKCKAGRPEYRNIDNGRSFYSRSSVFQIQTELSLMVSKAN